MNTLVVEMQYYDAEKGAYVLYTTALECPFKTPPEEISFLWKVVEHPPSYVQ